MLKNITLGNSCSTRTLLDSTMPAGDGAEHDGLERNRQPIMTQMLCAETIALSQLIRRYY